MSELACPDCGALLRRDGTCGNLCDAPDEPVVGVACEECGEIATHLRHCRDVTPTDRGALVTEYDEWQCDQCDPEWNYGKA